MVDTARQLLDELMGRNRNLDPTTAKSKKVQWDDPEVSDNYLLVPIFQILTCDFLLSVLPLLFGQILSARFIREYKG